MRILDESIKINVCKIQTTNTNRFENVERFAYYVFYTGKEEFEYLAENEKIVKYFKNDWDLSDDEYNEAVEIAMDMLSYYEKN